MAVLAFGFGASFSAFAECPAGAVQQVVDLDLQVPQSSDLAGLGAKVDAIAAACPTDAYVQKAAAIAHSDIRSRITEPAKAFEHAEKAWGYVMKMRDVQPSNEVNVSVAVANGQHIPVRIFSNDDFDTHLLLDLFVAEVASGKLAAEHQPVRPNERLRACRSWDPVDAQAAGRIINENLDKDIPPALNMLDRLAAICTDIAGRNQNNLIIAVRARALYKMVDKNPTRPDAIALLDRALVDSKRFFEARPNGDTAYWSTFDRTRLEDLAQRLKNPVLPEADWFKPGYPEKPEVIEAIAMKLDDAWAVDAPKGSAGSAAYKTYRDAIAALYARATTSGNIAPSKRAIALAAKGHSEGNYRKPTNRALAPPPGFLWNWIDPEVWAGPEVKPAN